MIGKLLLGTILLCSSTLVNAEGLYLELDASIYLPYMFGGSDWVGDNPGFRGDLYYQWDNGMKCGYSHQSNILNGPPFNSEYEDQLNQIYCGKVWKIL